MSFSIRAMTPEEAGIAVEWAAEEGWNPGLQDAEIYYSADPDGFLMGFLDGEPIASISVVKYGNRFGFLGFYIVKPNFRGQGYGIQVWNAGLEYLRDRNVGLDGVVDQQENYRKSGFELAYRNIRFQGAGGGEGSEDENIIRLNSENAHSAVEYDREFFPDDRSDFMQTWISQSMGAALGYMVQGKLLGFGVIRPCRMGWKIGPLFADSCEVADSLFCGLKAHAQPTDPVYLDVPEINSEAVDLAERYGMTLSFETARMYSGIAPNLPLLRTFGVTSFEIG